MAKVTANEGNRRLRTNIPGTVILTMFIRSGDIGEPSHKHQDKDDSRFAVAVPVFRLWQEGPNDLHVQIRKDGEYHFPIYNKVIEDYLIPNPYAWGDSVVRCYHIQITATVEKGILWADEDYLERLEGFWPSPNRHEWPGEKEVKNYVRKIKQALSKPKKN